MFGRRNALTESGRHRAGKSTKSQKRSFRDQRHVSKAHHRQSSANFTASPPLTSNLTSAIVTVVCGPEQRLFAAHEDVLCHSPFFAAACRGQFQEAHSRRIDLPDELPEIFSNVLEYLYKGDYFPALSFNKRRDAWELEDGAAGVDSTVFHPVADTAVLKDTVVYCTAEKYGLDELKRLALRKQGLQSGIQCSTILASARFAYANTPDTDSKMRAHYLSLIIRSRATFKRSGTMQMEMEAGGKLFFDLFVAMCNHLDDVSNATKSPRKGPHSPFQ